MLQFQTVRFCPSALLYVSVSACFAGDETLLIDRVEHHNIDNKGHSIHYVSIGQGPLLLFVHGAPDFWYLWHEQMEALCEDHRCDPAPKS